MKNLQHQILEYLYKSNGAFFTDTANHFISLGESPSDVSDMIKLLLEQKHLTTRSREVHTAYLNVSPLGKTKLFEYQEQLDLSARLQRKEEQPVASYEPPNKVLWYKDPIALQWLAIIIAIVIPIAILAAEAFF